MNIRNITFVILILFATSCTSNSAQEDQGHEHGTEHDHPHDAGATDHAHEEPLEQEEFTVAPDSIESPSDADQHTHEDGSTHHDH